MRVKMNREKKSQGYKLADEITEFNKLKALEDAVRAGPNGTDMYCRTHDYKVF